MMKRLVTALLIPLLIMTLFVGNVSRAEGAPVNVTNWDEQEKNAVKATIIHSINNSSSKALFKPKFDDVKFIANQVKDELKMGTVYTGDFDKGTNDGTVSNNPIPSGFKEKREYNILGYDIMARSEVYDKSIEDVSASYVEGTSQINKELAVMACYKALGSNYYSHQFYTQSNGTSLIPVGTTPFIELVGSDRAYVYPQYYYTNAFITRTVPAKYWEQSINAGLSKNSYGSTECSETVTTEDFCYMVYRLLELKGEPVLNDKETIALLVTYGSNLPQYLTGTNYEAVKYLMARGILDDNSIDYKQPITADLAMTILMRAKDKSSRTTFKDLTVQYNADLVSKGYYPTEVSNSSQIITNARYETSQSVTDYYDYFIKICDDTKFIDNEGNKTNITYIPDNSNGNNKNPFPGSTYVGTRNGYYQYRVPVNIKGSSAQVMYDGGTRCFYITAYSSSGVSKKIMVEYGGGVYNTFEKVSNNESSSNTNVVLAKRLALPSSYSNLYYDEDRKELAMKDVEKPVLLTSNQATFKCIVENPDKVLWKNVLVSSLSGGEATYDSNTKELTVVISNSESSNPENYIAKYLTTQDIGSNYPAYIKNDDNGSFLVSLQFFKDAKNDFKVDSVMKIAGKDNCYTIFTPNENIFVDTSSKMFVTGQSVTQLPASDTSPLIVYDDGGNSLIDYRIIAGVISGNMVLDSNNKVKSIMTGVCNNNHYVPENIQPVEGSPDMSEGRFVNKNGVSYYYLEGGYAKSNSVVYKLNNEAMTGDYLLVYTPRVGERVTSAETISILQKYFAVSLGEDEECVIYDLSSSQSNSTSIKKAPARIVHSDVFGYMYRVPKLSEFSMSSYLGTGDNSTPVSIVSNSDGSSFFDLNMNVITEFGKYVYPKALLNNTFIDKCDIQHDLNMADVNGSTAEASFDIKTSTMVLAPMAMTKVYFNPVEKKIEDVMNSKVNTSVYFGSMRAEIVDTTGVSIDGNDPGYHLLLGTMDKKLSNETFLEISYPIKGNKTLYVYKNPRGSVISDIGPASSRIKDGLAEAVNGIKNYFDWNNYNFIERLKDADNWLTILDIILLGIVPYILMLNFYAVAALALVSKYKLVKIFSARFFDPVFYLSWGAVTVDTVDPHGVWWSVFRGSVMLALLNRQDFLALLAWFMESVYRISFR